MKKQINEIKRMQQLAGIIIEGQLNKNINELISFSNANLEELKKYIQQACSCSEMEIDSITGVIEDSMGDAVILDGVLMGVAIKFAKDVDEDFVGENGDEPEYFKLGGREMAAVWYNI